MSVASADVQWQLLRHHHSFLVKRDGHLLSSEPLNLTNLHSYKFNGLVNNQVVGVVSSKKGAKKNISLITKSTKSSALRQPRSLINVGLNKHRRNHRVRSASTIQTATAGSHYRPDLTQFAVARYHALHRATKIKTVAPQAKKRRGAKKVAA
jgi:large subunit ribosomal protein L28e